jgi:RNA polymerase sigma-70 factor (ECF subfamily)
MPTDNPFEALADTDLMLRVQWGSEPAFAELYRRHYRRLLDFFYGMSGNVQRAEDLCHETFLRVWLLRVRYTVSGPFAAYLFAVARHIWLEGQREARKSWRLGLVRHPDREQADRAFSREAGPDELAHRSEIDAQVLSALDTLPEEQRMAFVLRTIEGLSLEDIAAIMRCPINTVRSRRLLAIHRLREALRGLLVL